MRDKINMNPLNSIKDYIEDLWWDLHWKATEIIDNWKYRKEIKALEAEAEEKEEKNKEKNQKVLI